MSLVAAVALVLLSGCGESPSEEPAPRALEAGTDVRTDDAADVQAPPAEAGYRVPRNARYPRPFPKEVRREGVVDREIFRSLSNVPAGCRLVGSLGDLVCDPPGATRGRRGRSTSRRQGGPAGPDGGLPGTPPSGR
jgi:hypothetical protein